MNSKRPKGAIFGDLAAVIGGEATWALLRELGGLRIFVPNEVAPDHEISRAIGPEAAAKLADHFHGTTIQLPINTRSPRRVREMAATGKYTRRQIADANGYTERQVYNILGPEPAPIPLFDDRPKSASA